MGSSYIDEAGGASEKQRPQTPAAPESLQHMGSGASVVLDPEGGIEAESRKLPSSKYKGVVPQPNGRWGAQIYEKHQRVWLGTFSEEAEAARVYDVAVQRFRGRDAVTNFKPLSESDANDAAELVFITSRSKVEIVDMLRKHTYHDELQQSKRQFGADRCLSRESYAGDGALGVFAGPLGASCRVREHLFDKTVTPSDVGKLNRLVIPKQHAEKHFPLRFGSASACKGVLLSFEDGYGKVWRFRYSYWNSSQSYVLTKGWSRFVKEKSLKAGDVVSFERSTGTEKQLYIDWKPLAIGSYAAVMPLQPARPIQVVRLFGVNLVKVPGSSGSSADGDGGDAVGWHGKRARQRELLQPPTFLKRRNA